MLEYQLKILEGLFSTYAWSQQLAGILPLSALIDFLDVPRTLHIFELTGFVPAWCWPVTPSGSRLLLSPRSIEEPCCLDKFGNSQGLHCMDGRYGDVYNAASPETLRLCLEVAPRISVSNDHENTKDAQRSRRPQSLTVVHVFRAGCTKRPCIYFLLLGASAVGWSLLVGLLVATAILRCYIALTFLLVIPVTGAVVYVTRGGGQPTLKDTPGSNYNRLVVAALHMNEINWWAFYGETTMVNALLNLPLRVKRFSVTNHWTLNIALRILVLGQWSSAIGAAATQRLDAYIITFWIVFCIFSNILIFSSRYCCQYWLEQYAGFRLSRVEVKLSSRRALLNTLVALNPDSFPFDPVSKQDMPGSFYTNSLAWIDPILKSCPERSLWEEATRMAMATEHHKKKAIQGQNTRGKISSAEPEWITKYKKWYWCKFISEGMSVAEKIKKEANLPGRFIK
ncbi:hypothetical protein NUW58_g4840 [Xylaria curta]|uniref:Uncharacterized protein n=1 Tax=Xylaria curta TaxID=42375 RepID=A0ACC1P4M0_9PEZI|nr:hypothetical protein NUW58_g4840 [Xylaria curta]